MDGLTTVLVALYKSEINVAISSFWDGGWFVQIGDDMNGFDAQASFSNTEIDDIPMWLALEAARLYPDSTFAKSVLTKRANQ